MALFRVERRGFCCRRISRGLSWEPGVLQGQRTEDPFGQQIGERPIVSTMRMSNWKPVSE
jgi:hypothetical protein